MGMCGEVCVCGSWQMCGEVCVWFMADAVGRIVYRRTGQ